jgi:metallophosphoesterase superfamily enzyme
MTVRISDEDLIADLRRVIGEVGPRLTSRGYEAAGQYAVRTLVYRFGSWEAAMARALGVASEGGVTRDVQPAAFRQHDDPLAHAKTDPPPPAFTAPALPIDPADEAIVDAMMARRRASTMRTPAAQRAAFVAGMDDAPRAGQSPSVLRYEPPRSRDTVLFSDIHVPDHHKRLWSSALAFLEYHRPERVIFTGDFLDLQMLSDYAQEAGKDQRVVPCIRQFVDMTDQIVQLGIKVGILEGNHDERWRKKLLGNLAHVFVDAIGLTLFEQARSQGLDSSIEWVRESVHTRGFRVGQFLIRHGHKQSKTKWGGGVNPAITNLRASRRSVIIGHLHRAQLACQTIDGETDISMTLPCMTEDHEYATDPDWQRGMGLLSLDAPSYTRATPYLIIAARDGSFSYGGRTFVPNVAAESRAA